MSRTLKEIAEEIAGWFITGLVALAFLGFIYWVAFVDRHSDELEFGVDVKIVQIGSEEPTHMGKSGYALCIPVLFETVKEPVRYVRLSTCSQVWGIRLTNEWIYNHRVGDTAHFKFLRKERFFEIKEEYRKDLQSN